MKTPELVHRGTLHFIDGHRLYVSRGCSIFTAVDGGAFERVCRLPLGPRESISSSSRLVGRLLRHHVYHVVPYQDLIVVLGFGRVWCIDPGSGELRFSPVPMVGGRPLALCTTSHGLYYGEYRNNPERGPIRLMFSADGVTWDVARELRAVRHIHGIYEDPYSGFLWMTTGDDNHESAIWCSTDRFATMEVVAAGSQRTRAISLLFTPASVIFGSDAPDERNALYQLDRNSGRMDAIIEVEGPVFHAARVGDSMLFSTAVEPSAINLCREAILYGSRDGESWKIVARHRKDPWSMKYFQYGQLFLPSGCNETGRFWYSTFAVRPDACIFSGTLE